MEYDPFTQDEEAQLPVKALKFEGVDRTSDPDITFVNDTDYVVTSIGTTEDNVKKRLFFSSRMGSEEEIVSKTEPLELLENRTIYPVLKSSCRLGEKLLQVIQFGYYVGANSTNGSLCVQMVDKDGNHKPLYYSYRDLGDVFARSYAYVYGNRCYLFFSAPAGEQPLGLKEVDRYEHIRYVIKCMVISEEGMEGIIEFPEMPGMLIMADKCVAKGNRVLCFVRDLNKTLVTGPGKPGMGYIEFRIAD